MTTPAVGQVGAYGSGRSVSVRLILVLLYGKVENIILMRSLPRSKIFVLVGLTAVLMTSVQSARGQEPEPNPNPTVFKAQLNQASLLGKRTLRALQALPADDSVPLDGAVLHNAHQTYVLIRAGRHGMGMLRERQAFRDPVFELAFKRVDAAWDLARVPVDMRGLPRAEYLPMAIRDLSKSMQLLDQALMLLP